VNVAAKVIVIDHVHGARYRDEMTGKPRQPRIAGGLACLTREIAPRDVVVVSRLINSDR
jgi:hypothetical protein